MKKPPQDAQQVGLQIGEYFLQQNGENYEKTREFLRDLSITNIIVSETGITVETARPGLLIGRKGIHIDNLVEKLQKKINIVESFSWADYITPVDWIKKLEMEQEAAAYQGFSDYLRLLANNPWFGGNNTYILLMNIKTFVFDSTFEKSYELNGNFTPRQGDYIDLGYKPAPVVQKVVYFPKGDSKFSNEEFVLVVV